LKVNGEAIYHSKPWRSQNETDIVWYTANGNTIFATVVQWPQNARVVLTQPKEVTKNAGSIAMLGHGSVPFTVESDKIIVDFSGIPVAKLPSSFAWTLRLKGFK
jgi:alpha-L-fucosidase